MMYWRRGNFGVLLCRFLVYRTDYIATLIVSSRHTVGGGGRSESHLDSEIFCMRSYDSQHTISSATR